MLVLLEIRCSVWFPTCRIAHICMIDMTSLIFFLLVLFRYWAAFVVYQQNWVNNNHIQVGSLRGCSRVRVQKCPLLPKICHTYPKIMKLSTVISYLTKIQNIYKSRYTPIKFCWHQYFFNQKLATLVISRNTAIDCILIHNC